MVNQPGTIDADFRGIIHVLLLNMSPKVFQVSKGDRIAQLKLAEAPRIEWDVVSDLSNTKRGAGGFGSTGKK